MQTNHTPLPALAPPSSQTGEAILRTYDLTKQYSSRVAVKRLNLEVRRGEIVGFLGPNGVGKTTSIRMLLGLITPTSGRVELFGQDLATRRSSLLPRVGALVEAPALYLHLSGKENVRSLTFGLSASLVWVPLDNFGALLLNVLATLTHNNVWRITTAYLLGPLLNHLPDELLPHDVLGNFASFGAPPLVSVDTAHALSVIGAYALIFLALALGTTWKRDIQE